MALVALFNFWNSTKKEADEQAIRKMMEGEQMCHRAKSTEFRDFLQHEMYHDSERDGCIESEYLSRFFSEDWFRRGLKDYGLNV